MSRRRTGVLVLLPAALALAAGLGVGLLVRPVPVPDVIGAPIASGDVTVVERTVDDLRTVKVTPILSPERDYHARVEGVLRRTSCVAGRAITSGAAPFTIGGEPLLALHLAEPPWRSLAPGDRGDDVRAVQRELVRMGRPLAVNGTFDRATAREVAGLWAAVGVTERRDLPLEGVLWLPAPSVAPATCSMPIGDDVKAGDVLFSTGGTLSALRLVLPEQVLPGARVAILDNLSAPISAGSIVLENKFVAAYSAQPAVRQWLADTSAEAKLTVATRLAAPISAVAVPASALFRLDADAGCVLDNGAPKRVRIVASEFGSTLVTAANLPTRVRVQAPANGPSCG